MNKLTSFKCSRCLPIKKKRKKLLSLNTQEGPRGKASQKAIPTIKLCSICRRGYALHRGVIKMIEHDGMIETPEVKT